MTARTLALVSLFVCFTLVCPLVAQEGHPLIGTWSGEWGSTPAPREQLLVTMDWKTTTLSGVINPGYPDEAPIRVGVMDSAKWTLRLEADSKDQRGNPVKVILDGKPENIGSHNRTFTGTWTRGNAKGDFKLTRE